MNDIARTCGETLADLFDLYPATIPTKIGPLRLVSATGAHAPESQFSVLEAVWGLPCDGLVYEDETERRGRHLIAVFHGATDDNGVIAVCHDWRWQWYPAASSHREVKITIQMAIGGVLGDPSPRDGTIVGDLARKGAGVDA